MMVQIHSDPGAEGHETVRLQAPEGEFDFGRASDLARATAREINRDAMMLAWFNRRTGEGFPDYDCGPGDRPPWQVFADARGGNLTIVINDGEFIFIYLKL